MKKDSTVIVFYNILFYIVIILGFPLIIPMILLSGKRRKTVFQRLGLTRLPIELIRQKCQNSERKLVWVHALSVGEVLSAVPLVKKIKEYMGVRNIVFSASTKTGFDIANQYLNDTVHAIIYFPYDLAFSVKHIVRQIKPKVVVIVETDIWPNFLFEMKKHRTPVVLVNARLSKKSFIGYKRFRYFTKQIFLRFVHICTQSKMDSGRFHELGVPSDRITTTGNVKFDQTHQVLGSEEIEKLRHSMNIQNGQKVFLAGSTHPGEESMLLDVFSRMKNHIRNLLLIVAPRDPERASSIYCLFNSAGFSVSPMRELKKSSSGKPLDVIIIDKIGILKTLYVIANIAFVGGSLVNCGGHNPLEPAAFSKPVIFGNDMSDFEDITKMLLDAGGAIRVKDEKDLYTAVVSLIEDENKAMKIGANALKIFNANKGALEKTMRVVKAYL